MILSIDAGNVYSGYALLDDSLKPVEFGKVLNYELLLIISRICTEVKPRAVVNEMIASYGMAVGQEVFQTCLWIGRFVQKAEEHGCHTYFIYRKEEKINLCGTMKAKDSNIRQALIDRFGGVGTKGDKGWFYGVSKDVWSAIAVGVTFSDIYIKGAR